MQIFLLKKVCLFVFIKPRRWKEWKNMNKQCLPKKNNLILKIIIIILKKVCLFLFNKLCI